jgi:branched-chain amino acid transport system ATP-binding protein
MSDEPLLAIRGLDARYGRSHVLQGITLDVGYAPLSIIGRNGMGKTTLCQVLMGLVPAAAGSIRFAGVELAGRRPHDIAARGIGYVPQGRRIFASLTVDEHLRLAARRGAPRWTVARIYELFPSLAERRRNGGAELSGGEQQMLAIARALLTNPRLVVMDEPTEGLAPMIVEQMIDLLRSLARDNVGLLLVEQNFAVATSVAERLAIMVNGRIALETTSAAMIADDALQRRHLGVSIYAAAETDDCAL